MTPPSNPLPIRASRGAWSRDQTPRDRASDGLEIASASRTVRRLRTRGVGVDSLMGPLSRRRIDHRAIEVLRESRLDDAAHGAQEVPMLALA